MRNIKPTSEEITAALLDAAKRLFLANGIASTEMKAIAEEAGLSRSTLYRYMIDKNRLAFLIATELLQHITEQNIIFTADSHLSGYEKLHQFTSHFIGMLCQHVEIVSFLSEFDSIFRNEYPDIPEAAEYMAMIKRMLHRTAQFLFEGMADGSIKALDNPLHYTSIFINTLFGLAERMLPRAEHYTQEHNVSSESVLQETAIILLAYIKV